MENVIETPVHVVGDEKIRKNGKIRMFTKLGFASANAGSCVVFGTISSLITLFYTDYVGISAATIALVMLLSRFLDGFSDLLAGFIIQRTHTRFGQARPWILGISLPILLSCVALVAVPQGSDTMVFWYVFITYNFANTICFTISDLSQCTLTSLITRDSKEREDLGVWRMGICPIGHILSAGCSLPLVKLLGNDQRAWIMVMAIWGVFALVTHIWCFVSTEEVVKVETKDASEKKDSLVTQFKHLFTNKYWWWMLAFWAIWGTTFSLTGTTMSYYTRYILGNDNLYTVFYILEKATWMLSMLVIVPFLRKKGLKKSTIMVGGCILVAVAQACLMFSPTNIVLNIAVVVARGVGGGPLAAFFNGIMADVTEYGQWKSHVRQESLICSASSVGYKAGCGIFMSLITLLLGLSGFVSSTTGGAVQPDSALSMVQLLYIWAIVIAFAAEAFVCSRFKLDEQLPGIMEELKAREARGEM